MMKKIGFLMIVGIFAAIFGYRAIQAISAQRDDVPGPTSNYSVVPDASPKYTPEELQQQQRNDQLKAELERESLGQQLLDRVNAGSEITEAEKSILDDYLAQHPEPYAARNPLDDVGGPDGASYYYVDNLNGDSATYDWIELRGDPGATWVSAWSGADDGTSTSKYAIGFNFPFYGVARDSVRFSTNGFIQFTTNVSALSNGQLPSTSVAGPAIFPYWDDLHLTYGGQAMGDVVAIKNFGNYTVMEYDSVGFCCAAGSQLKFEVIIFSDGKLKFQYNTVNAVSSEDSSMTIGIQSNGVAGSPALQYAYNTGVHQPAAGLAIWFYQFHYNHDFATTSILSPGTGTYPGSTPVTVTARFTNVGLTTESSPVKYSFNGGPVQTGTTSALPLNGFQDFTFATQFTTPSVGGTYVLTVWSDLATDQSRANDTLRANVVVCAPLTVPVTEGFEGTSGTALPNCWSTAEFGGDNDGRIWTTSTSSPHSGLRGAYIQYSTSSVTPNDWMFTAPVALQSGTGYLLDFWCREGLTGSTYYDSLRVYLTTASDNNSTVATVVPVFRAGSTTYQEIQGAFTAPSTGTYYLAFVYTGSSNAGGIRVDDITLSPSAGCQAPTVVVNDSSRVGSVPMTAIATGGYGGALIYQWYTGQTCTQANAIPGATSSTYTTFVSGDFACRVYRGDSLTCAACDWGHAEVLPPPPGETCNNPIVAAAPTPGTPTVITGTTTGAIADVTDSCNSSIARSSGPDHFISLTLTECRRITFALDDGTGGGDMYISVYQNGYCGSHSILCNDDQSAFDVIWWETPGQRGTGVTSFVGGELPAGTYIVRVARYGSSSGNYRLTIYDNGACGCNISCAGGDQPETAENYYDTSLQTNDPDGGCNSSPSVFGAISIGQTVCGVGFNYLNPGGSTLQAYYKDTDWYQFSVASADTIHWTVTPEFRATVGLLSTTCPSPGFTVADTADACSTKTVAAYLTPGDYISFVAPTRFVGNPLPSTYRATLTGTSGCQPDTITNLTVYRQPSGSNDVKLRWTPDPSFAGTYSIYYSTTPDAAFPNSWIQLVTGLPASTTEYVNTGTVSANVKRFYIVVGVCP